MNRDRKVFLVQPSLAWTTQGAPGALYGTVRHAGDVNGDGKDDLIVGVIGYDTDAPDSGRAVVYHGPLQPATTTDCP